MNKSPFFSVIIPTFNRISVIKRAIDSVLRQSFKDYDLWVVDDGSTDETQKLLKEYGDKLNIIKTNNFGVSAARNTGVKHSNGKWLSFLDSDDEWLENKLLKQFEFINVNPSIKLVHGEEIWIRRGKRVNPKRKHQKFGGQIYKKCLPLCLISPSAVSIKRELLDEMGGWDETYTVCEDYDLWLKITSLYEVGFINDSIIYKHGGHEDQLSAKYHSMDYYRIKSMYRIIAIRNLDYENYEATLSEIIKKAKILLFGYVKHNNLENYNEINLILLDSKKRLEKGNRDIN